MATVFSLDLSLSYLAVKANQIARKYQLQNYISIFPTYSPRGS